MGSSLPGALSTCHKHVRKFMEQHRCDKCKGCINDDWGDFGNIAKERRDADAGLLVTSSETEASTLPDVELDFGWGNARPLFDSTVAGVLAKVGSDPPVRLEHTLPPCLDFPKVEWHPWGVLIELRKSRGRMKRKRGQRERLRASERETQEMGTEGW